jgi:transcriptional regulator with XRE-family HTH domain
MPSANRSKQKTPAVLVGERIRARREALGLSQAELAARAGIDISTFSKLENGRSGDRGPTLSRLYQVARALRIPAADLIPNGT